MPGPARIPHVPGRMVGAIRRWDYLDPDDPQADPLRLKNALEAAMADAQNPQMLRFDCCSGIDTKLRLSEGEQEWHPDLNLLHTGDPRAYDIIHEFPREHIPIQARPWLTAKTHGDHPIEYRAYVTDGRLQGISNYYPQRPLPYEHRDIDEIQRKVAALTPHLRTPFLWNHSPMFEAFAETLDPSAVHCTMDFMVDQDDNLLFLEGGPPHEMGAHPCCFAPSDTTGLALKAHSAFS